MPKMNLSTRAFVSTLIHNDEKTNKLGSKVTVNGDGNITTEITQTGDDTTIGVKLNKKS